MSAIYWRNNEILEILLSYCTIIINEVIIDEVIIDAIDYVDNKILEILLSYGATISNNNIMYIITTGNLECYKLLLDYDINNDDYERIFLQKCKHTIANNDTNYLHNNYSLLSVLHIWNFLKIIGIDLNNMIELIHLK